MRVSRLLLTVAIAAFLLWSVSFAQEAPRGGAEPPVVEAPKPGEIAGTVVLLETVDGKEVESPMEGVAIDLLPEKEGAPAAGVNSGSSGEYVLKEVAPGVRTVRLRVKRPRKGAATEDSKAATSDDREYIVVRVGGDGKSTRSMEVEWKVADGRKVDGTVVLIAVDFGDASGEIGKESTRIRARELAARLRTWAVRSDDAARLSAQAWEGVLLSSIPTAAKVLVAHELQNGTRGTSAEKGLAAADRFKAFARTEDAFAPESVFASLRQARGQSEVAKVLRETKVDGVLVVDAAARALHELDDVAQETQITKAMRVWLGDRKDRVALESYLARASVRVTEDAPRVE